MTLERKGKKEVEDIVSTLMLYKIFQAQEKTVTIVLSVKTWEWPI